MSNYAQDYCTLGVKPDCSLQSLKAARRRLVKSWHPDRFSGSAKDDAEHRIKEINTAFDRLIEYHRNFGVLPGHEQITDATSTTGKWSQTSPRHTPQSTRAARTARNTFRWALVGIAVGILVATATVRLARNDGPTDAKTQTYDLVSAPTSVRQPTEQTAAATSPTRYFTIGSSVGEVYATQGVPTATEADAWHYGKSTVYFSKGAVTGWNHDPANPLHATPVPLASKQNVAKFFTFGSTKAEVRAVQGSPLLETDTLWDFGLSKVQFRDDRVIAWDSSPMQPLRARK